MAAALSPNQHKTERKLTRNEAIDFMILYIYIFPKDKLFGFCHCPVGGVC